MSEEDRTFKELVEEAHLRILLAQLDGSEKFTSLDEQGYRLVSGKW